MPPSPTKRGSLFVIAAPSGAGKTSLVQALLQRKPELHVSISYTTRLRRPNEQDGREYHFISLGDFWALEKQGQFLEYAQVFDNFYGTGRRPVESELARGHHVVLEIDWQGARQVRKAMPECVTIFVLPPSRQALEQRLRTRATDSEEVIARRLQDAVSDMSHWHEFDYVVINDEFDHAVDDLVQIIDHQERATAVRPPAGPQSGPHADRPLQAQRPQLQALLAELLA
ncbi:MAG: guanylate kinase [Sinobacteraceae bacterium]|nr:guanylate kinase [Nevskiaceae bacterium]MBV8852354.1 guanylate kinase [Nevskiaceae bacterium]MBV9913042.1 guanylate kinase [Nevskiaceae bacterium]